MTLEHVGFWLNFESAGPVSLEAPELWVGGARIQGVNGHSATVQRGQQARTAEWRITASDQNGPRTVVSNPVTIPATAVVTMPVDTFSLADGTTLHGQTMESGETWTAQVEGMQARIQRGRIHGWNDGAWIRGALQRGPSQYAAGILFRPLTDRDRGIALAVCVQPGQRSGYYLYPRLNSGVELRRMDQGVVLQPALATVPYPAEWPADSEAFGEIERLPDGTLRGYINGILLLTATDTTYANGGIGLISYRTTGSYGYHAISTFAARTAR